jgi:hypothetical protein
MKIFLLDAKKDIPVEMVDEILKEVLKLYK